MPCGWQCGDGVAVVRGHEDDMASAARNLRDVQSRHSGHLDVEEQNVRIVLLERPDRLEAVAGFRDDRKLRPEPAEHVPELVAEKRLVLSNNGFRISHRCSSADSAGPRTARSPAAPQAYRHRHIDGTVAT